MSEQVWKGAVASAVALGLALVGGCGGGGEDYIKPVPAAGTITYDGKPLETGSIRTVPDSGKGKGATAVVENGKFTFTTYEDGDGAIPGIHRVGVVSVKEVPTKGGDKETKALIPPNFGDSEHASVRMEIPPGGDKNIKIDLKKP